MTASIEPQPDYQPGTALPPPESVTLGPLRWLRRNLFDTWYNGILTVIVLWALYKLGMGLVRWALTGAEWRVVLVNMKLLMVGRFPRESFWRLWVALGTLALMAGASWSMWGRVAKSLGVAVAAGLLTAMVVPLTPNVRLGLVAVMLVLAAGIYLGMYLRRHVRFASWVVIGGWVATPVIIGLMIRGVKFAAFFPPVETSLWGGLLLTMILAVGGILSSFPLGVLLALGRRSALPVVRGVCIAVVEVVRGVPLITVLFTASLMLPLFLYGYRPAHWLRAMVGITVFTSAYVAENVRGGLQAVPRGQIDAAHAVGLSSLWTTVLIVLPQALRNVIPALVGQFISLFKDTSLVAIMGLVEILGISQSVLANPEFLGLHAEVYTFVALVYFVFSYVMSYGSRRLEKTLGVGER